MSVFGIDGFGGCKSADVDKHVMAGGNASYVSTARGGKGVPAESRRVGGRRSGQSVCGVDGGDSSEENGRESLGVDGHVGNGIGESIEALRASCRVGGQEHEQLSSVAAPRGLSPVVHSHENAVLTTTMTTTNIAHNPIAHIDTFDIPIPDSLIS